jgi:hypothetical protein
MKSLWKIVCRYGVHLVLFLVTGFWLALALHYGLRSAGPGAWSPFGEAISSWLNVPCRYSFEESDPHVFGCMTANETGDFLAGFFAPLAFLWLAAAVFIQSQELRAQRHELALTRSELKLSRGVAHKQADAAGAQAAEAKSNAKATDRQAQIMERQLEALDLQAANLEFERVRYTLRRLHQRYHNPGAHNLNNITDEEYVLRQGRGLGQDLVRTYQGRMEGAQPSDTAGGTATETDSELATYPERDRALAEANEIKACAKIVFVLREKLSGHYQSQFDRMKLQALEGILDAPEA